MEKPRQKQLESLNFDDLFGDISSYGEVQAAARKVQKFTEEAVVKSDGETIRSVSISSVPAEQKEGLHADLVKMGIHAWTDENEDGSFNFSIENPREIQKLRFFIKVGIPTEPQTPPSVEGDNKPEDYEPYAFPLPNVPRQSPNNEHRPKLNTEISDEVPEVDLYMQTAEERFAQGQDIEQDQVARPESKYFPNLKQFKQEYFFENGRIFNVDGNEIPFETYKQILLEAKDDPKKMDQAVKMSTGLVKFTVDRILGKFSPNQVVDADDLFQAGMEGLVAALNRLEDRDQKPSSYLVPYIEGHIRSQLRTAKVGYERKQNNADQIAKYLKVQSKLEREDSEFAKQDLSEREQKIAVGMGIPLGRVRKIASEITGKFEEYDDESPQHNVDNIEGLPFIDPDSIEYEKLREAISENLESMSPRQELAIRLYYGITSAGRWRSPEVYNEVLEDGQKSSLERGTFRKLIELDIDNYPIKDLNPAERMFLAIIGKIPEESISDLHLNSFEKPTEVTLEQIGNIFGTQRERSRQMIAKGLRKLKHPSPTSKLLKTGYVKKVRGERENWLGETIKYTRYGLDES